MFFILETERCGNICSPNPSRCPSRCCGTNPEKHADALSFCAPGMLCCGYNISITVFWDFYALHLQLHVTRGDQASAQLSERKIAMRRTWSWKRAIHRSWKREIEKCDDAFIHGTFMHMNNYGWCGKSARKETEYGSVAICISCLAAPTECFPLTRAGINRQVELCGIHTGLQYP